MALYTDTVMDHFMHPRNVGEIADADGVGEVGNAKCGDIMKMYLKIKDGKIEDVKFKPVMLLASILWLSIRAHFPMMSCGNQEQIVSCPACRLCQNRHVASSGSEMHDICMASCLTIRHYPPHWYIVM